MPGGTEDAVIRFKADESQLDGSLTSTRGKLKKFGSQVSDDLRGTIGRAWSGLSQIGGFAGVAGFAAGTRNVINFEGALTRLQINARASAGDMAKLREQIYGLGTSTGADPDKLLSGVAKYVELTGDMKTAQASLGTWAQVMVGQGASMEDIAAAAAGLAKNLHITGTEAARAFNIMVAQGKTGSILVKDMAVMTQSLAPTFKEFGKEGTEGLAEMGALAQTMRVGFGSAEETATGLEGVMAAFLKHADKFKAKGIRVFDVDKDGTKHMRDLETLIFETIDKTKGNPDQLMKLFGRVEALKGVLAVMQQGKGVVDGYIRDGMSANEVEKDAATYAASAAGRLEEMQAALKKSFSDALVKNLDSIVGLIERLAEGIKFIISHPLTTLGALAAFKGGSYIKGLTSASGLDTAAKAAKIAGATPVYVVNMGAGGMGGGGLGGSLPSGARELDLENGKAADRARQSGNAVATFGRVVQRAAIGLVVAETVGRDLSTLDKGAIVAAHGLTGMAGKLGGLATAVTALGDVVLSIASRESKAIDEKNEKIASSSVGEYALNRGEDFQDATIRAKQLRNLRKLRDKGQLTSGQAERLAKLEQGDAAGQQAQAAQRLLAQARAAGAVRPDGSIDIQLMRQKIAQSGMGDSAGIGFDTPFGSVDVVGGRKGREQDYLLGQFQQLQQFLQQQQTQMAENIVHAITGWTLKIGTETIPAAMDKARGHRRK